MYSPIHVQVPAQIDDEPVRVLGVRPEDAEAVDENAPLEPGTCNSNTLGIHNLTITRTLNS